MLSRSSKVPGVEVIGLPWLIITTSVVCPSWTLSVSMGVECADWPGPGHMSVFGARVGVCPAHMVWIGSEREVASQREIEVLLPERRKRRVDVGQEKL